MLRKFSPKATRFIDAAVDEMADREVRTIWASVRHDPGAEMPDRVAQAALAALDHYERQLWMQLTKCPLDEDAAADVSNDLGFVRAVESDLRRQDIQVGGRPSKTQYQYTLQDGNSDELARWAPIFEKKLKSVLTFCVLSLRLRTNGFVEIECYSQ